MESPSTVRGCIGRMFIHNKLIHHHLNNYKCKQGFIYTYPKIQYKIINGEAVILGIGEAIDTLNEISSIDYLNLKGKRYTVVEKKIIERKVNFGVVEKMLKYEFLTPWLALDEESYNRYRRRNEIERKRQLESILVGNLLSMSKGLEYVITDELKAKISYLKPMKTRLKGIPMLGFLGNFSVNFEIPDYWGIGKSVSRGFGTVRKQKSKDR